ncbi:MAG: hypothetical protein HQK76_05485 [Desulfobacterales bacterium]|nr:hypothetical protein [Desulfobacterales bacterium]
MSEEQKNEMQRLLAGIGGMNIIEGISFAVVQKTTRQTVIYADVKVN